MKFWAFAGLVAGAALVGLFVRRERQVVAVRHTEDGVRDALVARDESSARYAIDELIGQD